MISKDSFILYLLYIPQFERKYKLAEKGVFNVVFEGSQFYIDEDYIYFFSTKDLSIENINVGKLQDKVRMYRLPLDKRTYEVIFSARNIQDLTNLYDHKTLKTVPKFKNRYLESICEGTTDFEQELAKLEALELYEDCANLRDIINLNFRNTLLIPNKYIEKWQ